MNHSGPIGSGLDSTIASMAAHGSIAFDFIGAGKGAVDFLGLEGLVGAVIEKQAIDPAVLVSEFVGLVGIVRHVDFA